MVFEQCTIHFTDYSENFCLSGCRYKSALHDCELKHNHEGTSRTITSRLPAEGVEVQMLESIDEDERSDEVGLDRGDPQVR